MQETVLLSFLPSLAILAALGLPTMKRGAINAIDWFSVHDVDTDRPVYLAGMSHAERHNGWPAGIAPKRHKTQLRAFYLNSTCLPQSSRYASPLPGSLLFTGAFPASRPYCGAPSFCPPVVSSCAGFFWRPCGCHGSITARAMPVSLPKWPATCLTNTAASERTYRLRKEHRLHISVMSDSKVLFPNIATISSWETGFPNTTAPFHRNGTKTWN